MLLGAACVAGFGIHASREVLLPILFGFLFATAAQPLVNLLERLRVPSALAIAGGLVGMLLIFIAGSGTVLWGVLDIAREMPRYQRAITSAQLDLTGFFASHGLTQLAFFVQGQRFSDWGAADVGGIVDIATQLIAFATLAGLVAFFGLLERESLVRRLSWGRGNGESWSRILADTQRYLGIKTVTSAITGLLAAAVCIAADLPNPALWGAIAFWLNYVPVVGSILASIPPLVVSLASQPGDVTLGVLIGYLAINFAIGNYLEPRWQGAAAGLSPLGVVLSIAAWGGLLGPLGALLAIPLTMSIKIGCFHTRDLSWLARLLGGVQASSPPARPETPAEIETLLPARASLFS